jgi:hypothetical protein
VAQEGADLPGGGLGAVCRLGDPGGHHSVS